ncbi:MAG: hypothetical protein IJ748_01295, partial [Bacteroidales bacterium]|nr:hypothetical protein [Bacteroidales bacterium]
METNVVFIICIVLLAVAVPCVIGYYFLKITKEFILNEQKKTILEIQKISESEVKKTVTPLQLQAYE